MTDPHFLTVKKKHDRLDHDIWKHEKSCSSNDLMTHALKKEKLKLKDEMMRLEKRLPGHR